jgi:hypothetical protein
MRTDKAERATLTVLREGKKDGLERRRLWTRGDRPAPRAVPGIRDADCGEIFPD